MVKELVLRMLRSARYYIQSNYLEKRIPPRSPDEKYSIRPGYRHRDQNEYFDAITQSSEFWQVEVYEHARQLADQIGAQYVCDVGCGSGKKLLSYFQGFKTIGVDLPDTIDIVSKEFPNFNWMYFDEFSKTDISVDLLISADAIEHVSNPDDFMQVLSSKKFKYLLLSTPERFSLYGFDHGGPPRNPAHCREWTLSEFRSYVSRWFYIVEQKNTNEKQCTQMVICKGRNQSSTPLITLGKPPAPPG